MQAETTVIPVADSLPQAPEAMGSRARERTVRVFSALNKRQESMSLADAEFLVKLGGATVTERRRGIRSIRLVHDEPAPKMSKSWPDPKTNDPYDAEAKRGLGWNRAYRGYQNTRHGVNGIELKPVHHLRRRDFENVAYDVGAVPRQSSVQESHAPDGPWAMDVALSDEHPLCGITILGVGEGPATSAQQKQEMDKAGRVNTRRYKPPIKPESDGFRTQQNQ